MKITRHQKSTRKGFASQILTDRVCSNCGRRLKLSEGHFFQQCFGDEGFFICPPSESNEVINKNFWELLA